MRLEVHVGDWTFEMDTSHTHKWGIYRCTLPCRGCDYFRWEWAWFQLYNVGKYRREN